MLQSACPKRLVGVRIVLWTFVITFYLFARIVRAQRIVVVNANNTVGRFTNRCAPLYNCFGVSSNMVVIGLVFTLAT
jgi:hypothetical protein